MWLRLIIGIIVIYLLLKMIRMVQRGFLPTGAKPGASSPQPPAGEDLVEDTVCHTYVPVSHAVRISLDGKTAYFCSQKCVEQYKLERKDKG
jgi:YHS domain-containing protein